MILIYEFENEINPVDVGYEKLIFQKCGYIVKLEEKGLSKREQVWEQFNKLQDKK